MKYIIKRLKLYWPNGDFALRSIGQRFTHYFCSKISPEKGTQESESSGVKIRRFLPQENLVGN